MPHFLISSKNIKNNKITIEDPDLMKHLAGSLRLAEGEKIKFIDENAVVHFVQVESVSKKKITVKILESEKSTRYLPYKINVALSVLKTDAQNLAISNAVQMGVKGIYSFVSDNSTVRLDIAKSKTEKWQKIADEAFKQCERADTAKIYEVMPLETILKSFNEENIIILAEKNDNMSLFDAVKKIDTTNEILLVVGPEGGFSDREFEYFKNIKFMLATLGNLILKAPNAVTVGMGNLTQALEIDKL